MTKTDKNWQYGLFNICIGLTLISSLQGCEYLAKFARSDTGKAVLCGGGAAATATATYFACNYLVEYQAKGKTKADIDKLRAACIVLAAGAAMADGFYCWWKLSEKIVEDYDQTKEALGYNASQGYVVKILEFSVTPKIVRPGDEVKIRVKYALMSPNPTDEIKYQKKIFLAGEDKPRTQILTRQPGTWGTENDFSYKIDQTMPDGKIEMALDISLPDHHGRKDQRSLCINVTHQDRPDKTQLCPVDVANKDKKTVLGLFVVSKVKQDATVRVVPKSNANVLDHVRRNERFPVVDKIGQGSNLWYKIQLNDGREGWLRAKTGILESE